jgi:hypothetical protein
MDAWASHVNSSCCVSSIKNNAWRAVGQQIFCHQEFRKTFEELQSAIAINKARYVVAWKYMRLRTL